MSIISYPTSTAMAAAISPAIISYRCSQPTLFHSKLSLRSSSVAHNLSISGSSGLLSHAIKVVAPPGARRLNFIQCRVKPPGRYRRFRVIMDKPGGEGATKSLTDYYIQTLAKVVGSREEARKSIRNLSYEKPFGFECEIDEKTSKTLEGLPGVLKVLQIYN